MGQRDIDRELEAAQRELLARYAPDTRVRRLRWSEGETQALELGTGSPLVLVHGGLSCVLEWVPFLPLLARNHRVIAIDRPGHGLADAFDYERVDFLSHACTFLRDTFDALELRTAAVAASSLGGLSAVAFALENRDRVSRLALLGAPAGHKRQVPTEMLLMGLPLVRRPLARFFMSNITRESNRKFWEKLMITRPENLDVTLLDADVAHTRRNIESLVGLMGCLAGLAGFRRSLILGARWQELSIPTLLLWGDRDAFGTFEEGKALAARNSNMRLVRVPGAGHLPWLDDPERVIAELDRFLVSGSVDGDRKKPTVELSESVVRRQPAG